MTQRPTTFTVLLLLLCLAFPLLGVSGDPGCIHACGIALPLFSKFVSGISLFVLLLFSLQFVNARPDSPEGLLLVLLFLFNPMIGLTGSGSVASLTGTALAIGILALTIRDDNAPEEQLLTGIFFTGILAGLSLSFLPLVILPALIAFGRSNRKGIAAMLFLGAVAVWLIPAIVAMGFDQWIGVAGRKVSEYMIGLNEGAYGFPGLEGKRVGFLQHLFTDGLGGYLAGGGPVAIIISLGLILCFARGAWWMFHRETDGLIITIACICIYVVSILFYRNDQQEARHILPLLPIILFPVWGGAVQLMRGNWVARLAVILFLCAYVAAGIGLIAS